MAQIKTMYKGVANSPSTYLSQALVPEGTTIYVADGNVFGTLPNLAVIGDDVNAETILVNSKREDGGYEVTRAIEGSAKAWDRMSVIARNYTNFDDSTVKDNIALINDESSKNKSDIETANQEIEVIKSKNSEFENEISGVKESIKTITKTEIVNNLTETVEGKALDATQGKILKERVDEAFQSASEGKQAIAQALTGKGIEASDENTFSELAGKVGQIKSAVGDAKPEHVLMGKTFSNDEGSGLQGTLDFKKIRNIYFRISGGLKELPEHYFNSDFDTAIESVLKERPNTLLNACIDLTNIKFRRENAIYFAPKHLLSQFSLNSVPEYLKIIRNQNGVVFEVPVLRTNDPYYSKYAPGVFAFSDIIKGEFIEYINVTNKDEHQGKLYLCSEKNLINYRKNFGKMIDQMQGSLIFKYDYFNNILKSDLNRYAISINKDENYRFLIVNDDIKQPDSYGNITKFVKVINEKYIITTIRGV